MSLVKCPECGREISDKATACPHCGFPIAVNKSNAVSKPEIPPKSDSPKTDEESAPSVSTPKIQFGKIAKHLVFDNCNEDIIKKAFFLAAKRVNGTNASSKREGFSDAELEVYMNRKRDLHELRIDL